MAEEPVAETEVDDLGKTEPEDWYPFEICFEGIVTVGIATDDSDAGGIDDVTDEAGIDGTDDDGIDTDGSPIDVPLPNFKSSPPNCTSNWPTLSPGISTAELGIFEDGGILGRA